MEAATSGRPLPSKQQLLDFESRSIRPAGFAALAASVITVAGVVVQHAGLHFPGGNSDAAQLAFVHAHSSRLILSAVIQAIGTALFAIPLVFLFRAASARAERMRGRLVVLVALGPVLLAAAVIVISIAGRHISSEFADQAPAVEQQARERAQAVSTQSGTATQATTRTPDQAANDARENLADDLGKHYALASIAGVLQLIGIVGVLLAFIYTPLWAMRTGLLTRPVSFLGIVAGILLVLPVLGPLSGLAVVVWSAIIGLLFLGYWVRPLPPAWAAGEAIPWPRAGEDVGTPSAARAPGTVEGSGREVSEQPLPENGEQATPRETQGQRRKKRKRRK
jgi:hypothetical protein